MMRALPSTLALAPPAHTAASSPPGAERAAGEDEDDAAPEGRPEYADLLDLDWLERSADAAEPEEELPEVGLTIDLDDRSEEDELAHVVELDVGLLLTSLPPSGSSAENFDASSEPPARDLSEGSLGVGVLRELSLPEDAWLPGAAGSDGGRNDEAIGDDERFPVFDDSLVVPPPGVSGDDLPAEDLPSDDFDTLD